MANVVVNGLMTNYHKVGNGKIVVCLPGWGNTSQTFSRVAGELQESFTVLSLDLPGFGSTQAPPNAWGLYDYAQFVADWLKKIGVKQIEGLVGHSYGGSVAIFAAGNNIIKPKKLVLIASAGIRNKRRARKQLLKAAAKTVKIPLALLGVKHKRRLKEKFYTLIGSDAALLPHMELTYKRIIGEDVLDIAKNITSPTLLIYGKKDKDTPASDGRILASAITSSKLKVLDGGHFLHQEDPGQLSRMIKEFLNE